jgi:hypothetical protein
MAERRSFFNWLRDLFRRGNRRSIQPAAQAAPPDPAPPPRRSPPDSREQAQAYLARVRAKLFDLAESFNAGTTNRAQFQNLYVHYQREIRSIEAMIEHAPGSGNWRGAVTEGESVMIRRKHIARAQGYAIYENDSGMPLGTLGRFDLDPALLVPMLSAFRSATREIFGAGMRSTQTEGGRWVCFVPGKFTTMLAVFNTEPAGRQLEFLDDLHHLFEQANLRLLANRPFDPSTLLFPHEYFLGRWRR